MTLRVGVVPAPVRDTPRHIALAEELGFASAWVYDSPLLYHDPFATLARAADRTSRIGLGVGVVVPGLRAPVATVAALRTLSSLAPGRVTLAVGAGFTGRFTLGLGPVRLSRLAREIDDMRGLLAGEERIHPEGGRPVRDMPVPGAEGAGTVPLYASCRGPKAQALARERGDGAMTGILYPGASPRCGRRWGPRWRWRSLAPRGPRGGAAGARGRLHRGGERGVSRRTAPPDPPPGPPDGADPPRG